MDRRIVYPGAIPLDTDLLSVNKNAMIGLGFLAQAILGTNTVVDGLVCLPTTPASMSVVVGAGSMTQLGAIDSLPYGSIPADTNDLLVKMGINTSSTTFGLTAPPSVGQSINYLIEAAFQEADGNPVVLPYYNASSPAQSFSGPANSGSAQNTVRTQSVQLQMKVGIAATTGSQTTPPADAGWTGLYQITVAYGQTTIATNNIVVLLTAPFLNWKLPSLRPGFGSHTPQSFTSSGNFVVPAGVTQVEVEVWGGGSGSFASVPGEPSGGGSGGGYAKGLVTGLVPGQVIPVTVGPGGAAGSTNTWAGAGGSSSFGPPLNPFVSASGGGLNQYATPLSPGNGATPPGVGVKGDMNFSGSAGQAGISYQGGIGQGGMGGAAPMGGAQNSGTTGNAGLFPGGGASGAGTGSNNAAYAGAAGAPGLVVVRW